MFPNRSGAFLILEDRLSKKLSETGRIVDAVFGVDNLAGRFCAVCSGNGGVLDISKTGVFSFGTDSVALLTFLRSSDILMGLDEQGAVSKTETVTLLPTF